MKVSKPRDENIEIQNFNQVRHSDALIRKYQTPPGDSLYAYRSDDGNHHIVVSQGDEARTQWVKKIPATINRPIPTQKIWTIPDNWEQRIISKRDSIAYGLFYIPDSDIWVKASIPTNDWLVDAWYRVKSVGDIDINPVGNLGSQYDVFRLAEDYKDEYNRNDGEAIREVASKWDTIEEDLRLATEWVGSEGLNQMQTNNQPIRTDDNWKIEFHQGRIFRPEETIDLSKYEIPLSVILDELRDADLLPSSYKFRLGIDNSSIDAEYYLRGLIENNLSPAEATDYYMVEVENMTQSGWSIERCVDQSTVSANVTQAKEKLR